MTGAGFAASWQAHRGYLVDLAFRMLGDVGAAEDVVQEAFVRLAHATTDDDTMTDDITTDDARSDGATTDDVTSDGATDDAAIMDERGWLTVVTSRLCLDQIRSARSRREQPQDTALLAAATPLAAAAPVDPADRVTMDDQIRQALFVVLQRLGPDERVVFILHDVFATPFDAIATTLGRPVATCRQLARRARQKIADAAGPQPQQVLLAEHRLITEKFITACTYGDLAALVAVLHPQVWGRADFGADAPIGPQVNRGVDVVAPGLRRYLGQTTLVSHPAGDPLQLLAFFDRRLFGTVTLTVRGGLVDSIQVHGDLAVFGGVPAREDG